MSRSTAFGFVWAFLFLTGQTLAKECCEQLRYGSDLYHFQAHSADTSNFKCTSNCVYGKKDQPNSRYCFKSGGTEVPVCETPESSTCDRKCKGSKPRTCVFDFILEILKTSELRRPVDGRERLVLAYNKIIPGPPVVVCEQDDVIINVQNAIDSHLTNIDGQSNGTTLHLHGIRQKHQPWSDGVPYVTQCPFPPNETFTYKFNRSNGAPPGTYWYHSHVGSQRTNGAYGVLIVKESEERNPKLFDIDDSSHTLTLQEWYHNFTYLAPVTILVNGVGRAPKKLPIFDTEDSTQAIHDYHTGKGATFIFIDNPEFNIAGQFLTNYTVYDITELGKRYRFRIIGAISQNFPLRVSIDNHRFTAIATDTFDIEPVEDLTSLWITAGERYDIVVQAKSDPQTGEAFKIRIFGRASDRGGADDKGTPMCTIAWLRYLGQTIDSSYITPADCSGFEPSGGRTLNPVPNNVEDWNEQETDCATANDPGCKNIYVDKLRDVKQQTDVDTTNIALIDKYYLDLKNQTFNNLRMTYPKVPFLLQDPANKKDRCQLSGSAQPPPKGKHCQHVNNQIFYADADHRWVETILINPTESGIIAHPIHQHSGWFWVVGQGQYDETQTIGRELIIDKDKKGKLSRNFNLPPPKDTIQVPTNGYVIYRTKLNNAGTWLIHCHIDFHFLNGMAKVLQIGELGGPQPSNQAWNTGPLKKNTPCDIPPGNPHEIFWFIKMDPGTTRCVKPGTNVTFIWEGKKHNVNQMSNKEDWSNCQHFDDTAARDPTYTFVAEAIGTYYFACGVGNGFHCKSFMMKATVIVHEKCTQ